QVSVHLPRQTHSSSSDSYDLSLFLYVTRDWRLSWGGSIITETSISPPAFNKAVLVSDSCLRRLSKNRSDKPLYFISCRWFSPDPYPVDLGSYPVRWFVA